MKKLVFSAIALLAFTATSFAAEGKKEVKKAEAKNEVKAKAKKDVIVVSELCDSVYDSWIEAGCTRTNTGSGNLGYVVVAIQMRNLCLSSGTVVCG